MLLHKCYYVIHYYVVDVINNVILNGIYNSFDSIKHIGYLFLFKYYS